MNRTTLTAATILTLVAIPAFAWDNTNSGPGPKQIVDGGPGAQAISAASSRATAGAASSSRATGGNAAARGGEASVNVTNNVAGGALTAAGNAGGGSGWGTIPVSTAMAPSYYGASPCTGPAASAAGQFPIFGLSFGGQQMDEACRAMRAEGSPIAQAVLCRDSRQYRLARQDIGLPCAQDRPAETSQPVVYHPTPTQAFVPAAWCSARGTTDAQRRANSQSCGG